jgi:transposase
MKAYSLDFRQKIIQVYEQEKPSQRQLAKRFGVATSFIIKLLKQYRTSGNLAPKPYAGGKMAQLQAAELSLIREWVEADNDITLAELCAKLQQQTQIEVSLATMTRALQKLQLTRKKNISSERKRQ